MLNFIGNRYKLLNCEGDIEFNKIYKAKDAYNNESVLLKIVEHTPSISEDFISNLIDESTMLREINSPYILKIIDVGVHYTDEATYLYIVNEYSNGIGLESIIRGNYVHLEGLINMATQILKSLESAYSFGLYHGDLKPSNILVDEQYNVKVCDFGVTKANNGINLRVCNEIRYLSPHQLCINYTDSESDFFSLGLILFEAIFKKLPFGESKNEEEMLKLIDKGVNWNTLKAINGNGELVKIIKRLLGRANKYTNTQDIIIDLTSVMYNKANIEDTLEINEYSTKQELGNTKRKKSKLVLMAGIVALISLMVLISV
ncbi:MAG: serine/threonine-protein kinase [Peptostreptococcaceae bacterium]